MDLLNLNEEDFKSPQGSGFSDNQKLIPDIKKGNGIYKAVIRYLPYWENPKLSKYRKYSAILTHPVSNDKMFLDCPSTRNIETGEMHGPSILWTIDTLLRDKKKNNQDLDLVEEMRKWFNRYFNFTSPVYVYKDPQVKENEGKILVYSYGSKIENMHEALMNPEAVDESDPELAKYANITKCNPYSLVKGMDFFLVVKKGTSYGKDYSQSKFTGKITPFVYTYNGEKYTCSAPENKEEYKAEQQRIYHFLKENTPDMNKYVFKPWSEEQYRKIANYIKAMVPSKAFMKEIIDKSRDQKMNQLLTAVNTGDVYSGQTTQQPQQPQQSQQPQQPQQQNVEMDPEFENYMKEVDEANSGSAKNANDIGNLDNPNNDNADEFDKLISGM